MAKRMTPARLAAGINTARPVPVPTAAPAANPGLDYLAQYAQFMQQFQPQAPIPQIQAPYPVQPLVNPELGPDEIAYFDSLDTRLGLVHDQGMAQNQMAQTQLTTEHDVTLEDLARRYNQMRERLPGQYQNRGLLNSGIYQQGLTDYATDRSNAFSDVNRGFQNQLAGLQLGAQQMGQTYTTGKADNAAQRAAKRSAKAAIVRTVR